MSARRMLLVAAALGPAGPALAQALDCMIQPSQIVLVGAPAPGVVEQVPVERGDSVKSGQVLVQLNANVERANVALAREKADQVGEARSANGARTLAVRELERANELFGQQFVSATYIDKARAEAQVAAGRSDQANERRRQAERELQLALAQLEQRTIRAPIGGVVVDRYVSGGEYVEQKPMLRIAAVDPLRVDALVPAALFGRIKVGASAPVTPELFGGGPVAAVVKVVDRVIDAASNTFRVRLELPNPNGALPAGLRCKVDLGAGPADAPKAAPTGAPAQAPALTPTAPAAKRAVAAPVVVANGLAGTSAGTRANAKPADHPTSPR